MFKELKRRFKTIGMLLSLAYSYLFKGHEEYSCHEVADVFKETYDLSWTRSIPLRSYYYKNLFPAKMRSGSILVGSDRQVKLARARALVLLSIIVLFTGDKVTRRV